MNDNNILDPDRKKCSGKNCSNFGIVKLKIQLINRVGYFCEGCTNFLVKQNLAIIVNDNFEAKLI